MDVGRLTKSRAAARSWVTRSSKALAALLANQDATDIELQDAVDDLDKRLGSLDEAQSLLELEIDDAQELEVDIEEADKFRRMSRAVRIQAAQRLVDLRDSNQSNNRPNNSESGSGDSLSNRPKVAVRLPKLELPKYSGVLTEWQSFWDRFVALVDETEIPDISKFCYLQSLLEGEAASVIQGLSQTAANYPIACRMLQDRFGKPERIIFAHIQALLSVSMPSKVTNSAYITSLWKLQDDLLTHVRSLEALGVGGDQYGVFMTPVILSRLPHDIRLEWSRESSGHENDLDWLLKFLQQEIERRERSDTFKHISTSKVEENRPRPSDVEKKKYHSAASALQSSSEVNRPNFKCVFCGKGHKSENCYSILKLSSADREEAIRSAKLCFICLKKDHISKGCKAKCVKCKGRHNILCCSGNKSNSNWPNNKEIAGLGSAPASTSPIENGNCPTVSHVGVSHCKFNKNIPELGLCRVLQTAKVKVFGQRGMCEATVLFDNGSDRSYVSSQFVKRAQTKWVASESLSFSSFGGGKASKSKECNFYELQLLDCKGDNHSLIAAEIHDICAPLFRPSIPNHLIKEFTSLSLADDYTNNRHITIDILIGLDAYWRFVAHDKSVRVGNLVAQESIFGWILSGSCDMPVTNDDISAQLLCINNVSESSLHNFWDLESVGICSKDVLPNDSLVFQQFSNKINYCDGRYEVALPWKSDIAKKSLINNEKLARKRLENLKVKLEKNPQLQVRYNAIFEEYERDGIIEEVPPSEIHGSFPTYYLPHRPVIRESSSTTKVRPVFDASAVSYNGVSLNDCLECGPSLNPDLVEVLIRFRKWKVALTADITRAFLQIKLCREDQDVHRFLWQNNENVRIMRFVRVPFGNKSSPFLLNATVKHHLKLYPPSDIVDDLNTNLYVDDWLSGADTIADAYMKYDEASKIIADAGMALSKWNSNCKVLQDKFNDHQYDDNDSVKILGMQWFTGTDCFSFNDINIFQFDILSTKRSVLSFIARCFDPLGFLSPFIMLAKILFQDIWRLGLKWDDPLPSELNSRFQKWLRGFGVLGTWKVPRCYFQDLAWKDVNALELHSFGDASEKGYGACVYLRTPICDGSYKVAFVISRGKVAPLKKVSLPRLELLGALLCARLLNFVKSALGLKESVSYYCWTDSTVALSWIKGDPSRWKMFVANRVSEIQKLTSPEHWHHCNGRDNPADAVSRGVFAENLVSSDLWLFGPPWLSERLHFNQQGQIDISLSNNEYFEESDVVCITIDTDFKVFDFSRWSKFQKALNIVAWTLRFINNCKLESVKVHGPLSYSELNKAKTKLYSFVQREEYHSEIMALTQGKSLPKGSSLINLDPVLDDDGILRVKGRLEYADLSFESKHPIILPPTHIVKTLVRFQHVLLKHAGVATLVSTLRNVYWIVRLRRLAKTVCRECVTCRRHNSKACSQPVAPLPEWRVKAAAPFTITGLDFAGPLYCTDLPSKKLYILLFTCAVIRSVHLELTDSLSLPDCMLAIRRFAARRGLPSTLYSDNAKTFIGASHLLQQHYGPLSPEWKFIVPRSPWWGGWWERLIRSVKSALRKTLGTKCLSRCELETTLHEVEACINSRPLTFVGDDPDASNPLTPSHFLTGKTAGFQPEKYNEHSSCVSSRDLCMRESARQRQLDKFWEIWSSEYIRNLPCTVRKFVSRCKLKDGSVVLIQEDNVPRLSWPLGVIVKTYPGKDGIVRSVDVKTCKGVINRPIQRLHDLEISSASESNLNDDVSLANDVDESLSEPVIVDSDVNNSRNDSANVQTVESNFDVTRRGRVVKAPVKLNL